MTFRKLWQYCHTRTHFVLKTKLDTKRQLHCF